MLCYSQKTTSRCWCKYCSTLKVILAITLSRLWYVLISVSSFGNNTLTCMEGELCFNKFCAKFYDKKATLVWCTKIKDLSLHFSTINLEKNIGFSSQSCKTNLIFTKFKKKSGSGEKHSPHKIQTIDSVYKCSSVDFRIYTSSFPHCIQHNLCTLMLLTLLFYIYNYKTHQLTKNNTNINKNQSI